MKKSILIKHIRYTNSYVWLYLFMLLPYLCYSQDLFESNHIESTTTAEISSNIEVSKKPESFSIVNHLSTQINETQLTSELNKELPNKYAILESQNQQNLQPLLANIFINKQQRTEIPALIYSNNTTICFSNQQTFSQCGVSISGNLCGGCHNSILDFFKRKF